MLILAPDHPTAQAGSNRLFDLLFDRGLTINHAKATTVDLDQAPVEFLVAKFRAHTCTTQGTDAGDSPDRAEAHHGSGSLPLNRTNQTGTFAPQQTQERNAAALGTRGYGDHKAPPQRRRPPGRASDRTGRAYTPKPGCSSR